MTLGEHIITLRKSKSISQSELGKAVGTSGDIIGRYERDEVKLSIEVGSKIAEALEVSLDYLVGEGVNVSFDKKILNAYRILRSWTTTLRINSTLLLITSYKILKLKKLTHHKNQSRISAALVSVFLMPLLAFVQKSKNAILLYR